MSSKPRFSSCSAKSHPTDLSSKIAASELLFCVPALRLSQHSDTQHTHVTSQRNIPTKVFLSAALNTASSVPFVGQFAQNRLEKHANHEKCEAEQPNFCKIIWPFQGFCRYLQSVIVKISSHAPFSARANASHGNNACHDAADNIPLALISQTPNHSHNE